MRIDGGDRDVDDFETIARETFDEHLFEDSGKSEIGLGIAEGSGFTEDEDSFCAGRFRGWEGKGRWGAGKNFGEESAAEFLITGPVDGVVKRGFLEKVGGVSEVEYSQGDFEEEKKEQWRSHRQKPEEPHAGWGERRGLRFGFFTFAHGMVEPRGSGGRA